MQELELLDKNNNPLTHAMYHKEQVQEAQKRHRRPLALEIPQHLQEDIKEYLAQVSFHFMMVKGSCSSSGAVLVSRIRKNIIERC